MEKKAIFLNFLDFMFGDEREIHTEELAGFCQIREEPQGTYLFQEGDSGRLCYFLYEGAVRLSKIGEDGREVTLHIVQKGELFAEALLFLENRYPVSAYLLKESSLVSIDAAKMYQFIESNPPFAMRFIGQLVKRLKYLTQRFEEFTLMDVETRMLNYLQILSHKQKNRSITLEVPKREVAMLLGTTPESVSRILRKLEESGKISVQGRQITLNERSLTE